jgi:hypothetical protein
MQNLFSGIVIDKLLFLKGFVFNNLAAGLVY